MAVFAIWSVPGFRKTRDECSAYLFFTGNPGGSGIYIIGNTGDRCGRYLVVSSDRMGTGRHRGTVVL